MIEAIRSEMGQSRANCICDVCAREEIIPCSHERRRGCPDQVNQGQATKKLTQMGWSFIRNKLRCPMCEAKRKSYEHGKSKHVVPKPWANGIPDGWHNIWGTAEMKTTEQLATVTEIRQPTRDQKRDIRAALDLHYDLKTERYSNGKTDLTIAKMIGGGCMPGWVAAEREDGYGPDGGNEQIEAVMAQIASMEGKVKQTEQKAADALSDAATAQKDVIAIKAEITALTKTITAIKAAVGPKAARA